MGRSGNPHNRMIDSHPAPSGRIPGSVNLRTGLVRTLQNMPHSPIDTSKGDSEFFFFFFFFPRVPIFPGSKMHSNTGFNLYGLSHETSRRNVPIESRRDPIVRSYRIPTEFFYYQLVLLPASLLKEAPASVVQAPKIGGLDCFKYAGG